MRASGDSRVGSLMAAALTALAALVLSGCSAGCSAPPEGGPEAAGVKATYSKTSGKLELITYDTNKDGRVDAWSHMDGARLVSMDIDRDFDGKPDRWEYYAADGALEKVGMSRAGDGKVNAWAFQNPDGGLERMEVDTDYDGRVDTWETYRNVDAGIITLSGGNQASVTLRGISKQSDGFINLKSVKLSRQE